MTIIRFGQEKRRGDTRRGCFGEEWAGSHLADIGDQRRSVRGKASVGKCSLFLPSFFRLFILAAMAAAILWGQTDLSTIRGTTTDSTAAMAPGVQITLTEVATNVARSATTDSNGNFEIPYLKRGTYRLTAARAGFSTFVANDVILESNQTRRFDIVLQVGEQATEITVSAQTAVIETEGANIVAGFTERRYLETPLAQSWQVPWFIFSTLPTHAVDPAGNSTEAGFSGNAAEALIDGVVLGNGRGRTVAFSNEDLADVKIAAVNNSAEYSRPSTWNVVTKAGTNEVHGRAFYYLRNEALNARAYFSPRKSADKLHTFGGQLSAPVVLPHVYQGRNRTFFYGAWNHEFVPAGTYCQKEVPTLAMRKGDFSQLLSQTKPVTIKDPLSSLPFAGNMIPTSRLNASTLKAQNTFFPEPNQGGPSQLSQNFGWLFNHGDDYREIAYFTGRVDHQISQKNTVAAKMSYMREWYTLAGSLPSFTWDRLRRHWAFMVSDTHTFSPHLVNEWRSGFTREHYDDTCGIQGAQVISDLGLQGISQAPSGCGMPAFAITGFASLTVQPGRGWSYTPFTFADSATLAVGRHVLKMGGEMKWYTDHSDILTTGTFGSYAFNGVYSGYSYSDFLLGIPYSSSRITPVMNRNTRTSEWGVFVEDQFKWTKRLTLTYGLRWDLFPPGSMVDQMQYRWDRETGRVVIPSQSVSLVSSLYPSSIEVVPGQVLYNSDKTNFAPRLGVAYRIADNSVVRAGWGVYNENLGYQNAVNSGGPFQIGETFYNSVSNGEPLLQFPQAFASGNGVVASQSAGGYPLNLKNGYYQQYNFTLERQFGLTGLRWSYIGSRGTGLHYSMNINKPPASLVSFSANRRPYSQYVNTTYILNGGNTRYNALQAQIQRKAFRDITLDASYTWARNMSDMLNLEDPYHARYWNQDWTPRQRFVLSASGALPIGRGKRFGSTMPRGLDAVVGGWNLSWITFLQTGTFFSPSFSGSDPSGTNTSGGLPDRVASGNLPSNERSIQRWFDAAAFTVPEKGRYGNSGTYILEGPGLNVHHLSLVKRFVLSERLNAELMGAVSNVFNHPNFNYPRSNISVSSTVGTVVSEYGFYQGGYENAATRRVQLRLRLEW